MLKPSAASWPTSPPKTRAYGQPSSPFSRDWHPWQRLYHPYFYLTSLPAGAPVPWWGAASVLGWFLTLNIVPVMLSVAVTRYRLGDIDLVINRTLVYGVLMAIIVGLYGLVVGGTSLLLQQRSSTAGVLVTAVLIIVLFKPLRSFLQQQVDRLAGACGDRPFSPPAVERTATGQHESTEKVAALPLSGRWLRLAQVAWLVLALAVAALWFWAVRIWAEGGTYWGSTPLDVPYGILMPAGYFIIAILLVARKPNDRMAILTSLMLVFLGPYLLTGVNVTIGAQPGWETINRLLVGVGGVLFLLFLFVFPDGRFLYGWTGWLAVLLIATYFLSILFSPELYVGFTAALIPVVIILGIAGQIYRYRRLSSPVQRQQTKWVVVGAVGPVLLVLYWILILVPGVFTLPTEPVLFYAHQSVHAVLGLPLPVTLAFSILRYRLWDIDLIINRTLVYGVLTAVVVGLYALTVGGIAALFQMQTNWLTALIATGLVAVLFQPLRDRLQYSINRLLYGDRDEPLEVLTRLGQRLEDALAPEQVLPTLVETIAQTLKLPYAAITMQQGDPIASFGKPAADPQPFPLIYQGTTIGHLLAAPRSPGESFTPAEERLLQNVARQAGTAVHALQLTNDLRQARQQIVISREEERRRLRRDLHDGLGPSLAAQLLKIGSARALLHSRPDLTDRLLAEMEADIDTTLADVRRIVYDLRPPALDQWGLVGALRAYAETCQSGALTVRVEAPEALPPLPAAVEVAAYHIGREGLTNVVRHAQARHCTLRLWMDEEENGHLHLSMRDDGQGFVDRVKASVGLTSMRERAAELGGVCTVEAKPGVGTQVTAVLPLGSQRQS